MFRSIAVLFASSVCVWSVSISFPYIYRYLAEPENTYRLEYLSGAIMVGGIAFLAWGPLLLAAGHSKSGLRTWQRGLAWFAGSLAAAGLALPIVLPMLPN